MANKFVYSQPVKIYFGEGEFARLGEILSELGSRRCVIACGRHFAPEAEKLRESVEAIVGVFGGVEQNPQLSGIEETVRLCRSLEADTVIGIGGGSSLDTAKFAAAVTLGEGEPLEYYRGTRPFPAERLTIVAVPTTAGTGSEVTQVSVVSHGTEKKTINNLVFMPRAAIVDPVLSSTVPPRTTMNTGLDAMAHALEGYWSRNHQPISDLMTIEAVRLILANLETAYRDGSRTARPALSRWTPLCASTPTSGLSISAAPSVSRTPRSWRSASPRSKRSAVCVRASASSARSISTSSAATAPRTR